MRQNFSASHNQKINPSFLVPINSRPESGLCLEFPDTAGSARHGCHAGKIHWLCAEISLLLNILSTCMCTRAPAVQEYLEAVSHSKISTYGKWYMQYLGTPSALVAAHSWSMTCAIHWWFRFSCDNGEWTWPANLVGLWGSKPCKLKIALQGSLEWF